MNFTFMIKSRGNYRLHTYGAFQFYLLSFIGVLQVLYFVCDWLLSWIVVWPCFLSHPILTLTNSMTSYLWSDKVILVDFHGNFQLFYYSSWRPLAKNLFLDVNTIILFLWRYAPFLYQIKKNLLFQEWFIVIHK